MRDQAASACQALRLKACATTPGVSVGLLQPGHPSEQGCMACTLRICSNTTVTQDKGSPLWCNYSRGQISMVSLGGPDTARQIGIFFLSPVSPRFPALGPSLKVELSVKETTGNRQNKNTSWNDLTCCLSLFMLDWSRGQVHIQHASTIKVPGVHMSPTLPSRMETFGDGAEESPLYRWGD